MAMRLGLSQNVRMEQRLVQSPQMIQAMQILQLSSLDLEARVAEELIENPFLEVKEPGEGEEAETREDDGDATDLEGMLDVLERYERDFGDGPVRISREDVDRKFEAMQNTPATYHSLGEALLEHATLTDLDERQRGMAEYIVYSLDHRGYLTEPLESLVEACEIEGVTEQELETVKQKSLTKFRELYKQKTALEERVKALEMERASCSPTAGATAARRVRRRR